MPRPRRAGPAAAGLAAAGLALAGAWGGCWAGGGGRRRLRPAAVVRRAAEQDAQPWKVEGREVRGEGGVGPGEPPRRLLETIFGPGLLGIDLIWMTGEVTNVYAGGQAERAGVQPGWYFETVEGRGYSEALLDARVAGQRPYAVTFKEGWLAGPAELATVPGKRTHHVLWQTPEDFDLAWEEEFAALRRLAESEDRALASAGPLAAGLAAEEGAAALRKREAEVRQRERLRMASELLYLATCAGLWRAGAALVGSLEAGGEVSFGAPPPASALTSAVHSPLALAAVEEHLARSLASVPLQAGRLLQLPLFSVGQAYAMSLLFGHVLRRAEERWSLERLLGSSCGGTASGEASPGRTLQRYVEEAIGPGSFQDMMSSREAQRAADMQVRALFGDLRRLQIEILHHLGMEAPGVASGRESQRIGMELEAAIQRGEVTVIRLRDHELRRLLLEAVAFGALLREAEVRASSAYTLTPAVHARLDRLGIETDESGCPVLPPRD